MICLGLMCGTSLDGIDIAAVEFTDNAHRLIAAETYPLPDDLQQNLQQLINTGKCTLPTLGAIDQRCARAYTEVVNRFIQTHDIQADVIGSHGQTVWHAPTDNIPFTIQLGDPNYLAATTGIDVVADFRRKDMALGGQGAPLAPILHQYLYHDQSPCAVVNIGGFANVTIIAQNTLIGFDTGPGNTLMDNWLRQHTNLTFDDRGKLAASGQCNQALLQQMLSDPYFALPAPKSTGREYFNLPWLAQFSAELSLEDMLATLVELSAITIANGIKGHLNNSPVFLCGGGVHNDHFLARTRHHLPEHQVNISANSDAIEAILIAYLAYLHITKIPVDLTAVTGTSKASILGGLYYAS